MGNVLQSACPLLVRHLVDIWRLPGLATMSEASGSSPVQVLVSWVHLGDMLQEVVSCGCLCGFSIGCQAGFQCVGACSHPHGSRRRWVCQVLGPPSIGLSFKLPLYWCLLGILW